MIENLSSCFQKVLQMDAFLLCASIYFFVIACPLLLLSRFGYEHQTLSVWESSIEQNHNGCDFEGTIYSTCYYVDLKLHDPSHHDSNHCSVVYPDETPYRSQVEEWFLHLQPGNQTSDFVRLWNEPKSRSCYSSRYVSNIEISGWVFLSVALMYLLLSIVTFCISVGLQQARNRRLFRIEFRKFMGSPETVEYIVDSSETIV